MLEVAPAPLVQGRVGVAVRVHVHGADGGGDHQAPHAGVGRGLDDVPRPGDNGLDDLLLIERRKLELIFPLPQGGFSSELGGDGTHGVVVHRRGGVNDAVAAVEGGAEAGPVEQVHLQHREALRRAVERPEVRVLGVICAAEPRPTARKKKPSAPFRAQERILGDGRGKRRREQQRVPARRVVPRTAYPRSRRSLTIQDPMKPPAPVTHTVTAMGARPGKLPNRQVVAAVAEMRGRRREMKIDPSWNFAHEA